MQELGRTPLVDDVLFQFLAGSGKGAKKTAPLDQAGRLRFMDAVRNKDQSG